MPLKNKKGEIHVLLVGYDPIVIKTEKNCLEDQGGLCVETALSNDEALAKMKETKPDVIVGDFTGISPYAAAIGFKLVRTLRSKGDTTPFILFSYDDEEELVSERCESGQIEFVEKSGDASTVFSNLKNRIVSMAARP